MIAQFKQALKEDTDFLRPLIQTVAQELLEEEMNAAVEAFNQAGSVSILRSIVIGELYVGLRKCSKPDQEEKKIASMIARTEALIQSRTVFFGGQVAPF